MPARQPSSRRPGRETERAFIDVATSLFAEKGYHGTSIADVANQLGLTTASLYYHVNGKQDLLLRVLETGMTGFLSRLESILAEGLPPYETLEKAVTAHLEFVLHNPKAVRVFLRERRFLDPSKGLDYAVRVGRYDDLFTSIIQRAMDVQVIPQGNATLMRLYILGMINWCVEWFNPSGPLTAEEVTNHMTDVLMNRLLRAQAPATQG